LSFVTASFFFHKSVQMTHINKEIMQKFRKAAESGEAIKHLQDKLIEGAQFDFDAVKLLNGTMTEDDWQNLYTIQKKAWHAAVKAQGHNRRRYTPGVGEIEGKMARGDSVYADAVICS